MDSKVHMKSVNSIEDPSMEITNSFEAKGYDLSTYKTIKSDLDLQE